MTNSRYKYSNEQLARFVAESYSVMEVMRKLGIRLTGGSHSNITKRIKGAGISMAHFTAMRWNKGKKVGFSVGPEDALVSRDSGPRANGRRASAKILRRSLLAIGREYQCEGCGIGASYNDLPMVLEIDHVDNNWLDDRAENLRFLCPNCHSQKNKGLLPDMEYKRFVHVGWQNQIRASSSEEERGTLNP